MQEKQCGHCKEIKYMDSFYKNRSTITGYTSYCKVCCKDRNSEEYKKPKVREAALARSRTPEALAKMSAYQKTEGYKKARAKYRDSGKQAAAERKKYKENPQFRLKKCISARMRSAFKTRKGKKGGRALFNLLPYTLEKLTAHLEVKFSKGMSWDNYGEWHVDHVVPDSHFKYASTDDSGFQECWALDNLQPLWAVDNLRKSNNTEQE